MFDIGSTVNIPFGRWPTFVLVVAGAWALYVFIASFTGYVDRLATGAEVDLATLTLRYVRATWPLLLITLAIFAWVGRLTTRRRMIRESVVGTALLVTAIAVVYVPLEATMIAWNNGRPLGNVIDSIRGVSLFSWFWDFTLLLLILGAACAWAYYRSFEQEQRRAVELAISNERLAADLARLELDLLRAQLEPHFLFNALNSVSALIRSGNSEGAAEALAELSELLRYAIESGKSRTVAIDRELAAGEDYLRLQSLRFGDRIRYAIRSELPGADIPIPPMLLHPLLENAVKHGLADASTSVDIDVHMACEDERLAIRIRNTVGTPGDTAAGFGVGLRSTRRRLECLYGDRFELSTRVDGAEHVVQLLLPVEGPG